MLIYLVFLHQKFNFELLKTRESLPYSGYGVWKRLPGSVAWSRFAGVEN
jgi:hypothetical protein